MTCQRTQPQPLRICTPATAALDHRPQGQNETTKAPLSPCDHPPTHLRSVATSCPRLRLCELARQPVCAEVAGRTVGPQMSGSQSRAIYQGFAWAKGWALPIWLPLVLQPTDSAPSFGSSSVTLCTSSTWSKPWATSSDSWVPVCHLHAVRPGASLSSLSQIQRQA